MGGGALFGGLLGGLATGITNAQNAKDASKQALSDQEHNQQLADKNNTIKTIQAKMATFHPNSPEYGDLQTQLNQVYADRTALFHPDQPGGLERLGKMVWERVHGSKPQPAHITETQTPATPASTSPGMPGAGPLQTPALPATSTPHTNVPVNRDAQDLGFGAPAPPPNPHEIFRNQLKSAIPSMSEEDLDNAVQVHAGVAAKPGTEKPETWQSRGTPIKDASGNWVQPQFNKAGEARNQPMAAGYEQATKVGTSNAAIQRAEYAKSIGKKAEDLTFEDEQNMIRLVKQAGAPTTTTGRYAFVPQKDGSVKAVWTESTSSKSFGGKQPTTAPRTMVTSNPKGLVEPGNIPIDNRPIIQNANGSHSSELSLSMGDDQGNEVLVPTVVNGKFLTPDGKIPPGPIPKNKEDWDKASPAWKALRLAAWSNYEKTGQHLGKFSNPDDADAYANQLHNRDQKPKTAGEAKKQVAVARSKVAPQGAVGASGTASVASPGATVGGRATAPENAAKKLKDTAYNSYLDVQKASKDPTPVGDQGVILSWLRGRVNRVTATEIAAVNNLGGAKMALEGKIVRIVSGEMTNKQREWFLRSAKENYDNASTVYAQYEPDTSDHSEDDDFLKNF